MQIPWVQTRLARWAASSLSKNLNTEVRINKVEIDFFNKLHLNGLLILDREGDTLISVPGLDISVKRLNLRRNRYRFYSMELHNPDIRLVELDTLGTLNIDFVTDYFSGPLDTTALDEDSLREPLLFQVHAFRMQNAAFSYYNPFFEPVAEGFDGGNMKFTSLEAELDSLLLYGDTLTALFRNFSLQDHSGFALTNLSANARMDEKGMHFTKLDLHSGQSSVHGAVELLHDSWGDFGRFTTDVGITADLDSSRVHFADVGYFAPGLKKFDFSFGIDGSISGTIANLKGRKMYLTAGAHSIFRGSFDAVGLPEVGSTFLELRVKQLSSDYADVEYIGSSLGMQKGVLPLELKRAGALFFDGSFTGFPGDFVAYGNLLTGAGPIAVDLNLETDTLTSALMYKGSIKTKAFNIGRILAMPELGTVTADAELKARSKGTFEWAEIDGLLHAFSFKGYEYRNIELDGRVSARMFEGKLSSADPNLMMKFDGLVDFSGKLPKFDFRTEISNADLTALNLLVLKQPFSFSSSINIVGTGSVIDEVSGFAEALQTHLCYGDTMLFIPEMRLTSINEREIRKMSFISDVMDFSLTGQFKPSELVQGIVQQLAESVPSLNEDNRPSLSAPQSYDFSLVYKASNRISSFLIPGLQIAEQSSIYGSVNSTEHTISVLLRAQLLAFSGYEVRNITLDAGKQGEISKGRLYASEAILGKFKMQNIDGDVEALNNTIQAGFGWLNENEDSNGDFDLAVNFLGKDEIIIDLYRGVLGANTLSWQLADTATIAIVNNKIAIDTLAMTKDERYISVAGTISDDPEDQLHVNISDFNLADIDSLGIDLGSKFKGLLNLDAYVSELRTEPRLSANGGITDFWVDDALLGDVSVSSNYDTGNKKLFLHGGLSRDDFDILGFEGTYTFGAESPLDGQVIFDQFNLEVVNVLGLTDITDFSGEANGRVAVSGSLEKPVMKGFIDFQDAMVRIDYLNVFFKFSDRLRIEDGWFGIDYKPFYDQEGNKGFIVASVVHDDFSNFTYDFSCEVENFFVMNTTREMNSQFFGTARATGSFQIGLFEDLLEINIEASTDKGTSIKLPLDESGDVTLENFVYFVDRDSKQETDREANLEDIQMRVNLDVTSDAEVQLIFNEQTGDIMRGRGEGYITLEIEPSGEFKMFGRYEIIQGDYLFTLRDLLNKQFKVRPGSTIGWYGDPFEADLDISAVYSLRTPLYPIMVENQERYRGREDVDVVLNLTDKLLNPTINFDIELPQSTESERSQLAGVVSTSQQLNQQVFSLLILNRFLPSDQNAEQDQGSGIGGLGAATTSDFVSTQISNWLSQISRDFDIGLNYRPGDQISNQEVAVALSTQLFNERLMVSGNFGVTSASETQYTQGQSGILGDFLLEYSLTESGAIRLKVFNETNPYEVFSTGGSMYTQGVGLVYQEDFDTFDEFISKIGVLFSSEKKK